MDRPNAIIVPIKSADYLERVIGSSGNITYVLRKFSLILWLIEEKRRKPQRHKGHKEDKNLWVFVVLKNGPVTNVEMFCRLMSYEDENLNRDFKNIEERRIAMKVKSNVKSGGAGGGTAWPAF